MVPGDRQFFVEQLFIVFEMRRFHDVKEVMVKDVRLLECNYFKVYVRRSNTNPREKDHVCGPLR